MGDYEKISENSVYIKRSEGLVSGDAGSGPVS